MLEMSPQDLFDLIKESNNGDEQETVQCIQDLLGEIRKDVDKFCNKLDTCLEEFAIDNNICVGCGEFMQFRPDYTLPSYQGQPVGVNVCPNGCDC